MSIITLLVAVILFCLIWWALATLMSSFGVPEPVRGVVLVLYVVIAVLWLLQAVGWLGRVVPLRF